MTSNGTLVRWLLDNQLVDEITVFVGPGVVGRGTRLFAHTGPDTALELVDSRACPKGVTSRCTGLSGARSMRREARDGGAAVSESRSGETMAFVKPGSATMTGESLWSRLAGLALVRRLTARRVVRVVNALKEIGTRPDGSRDHPQS
jgi:hypothetical protein